VNRVEELNRQRSEHAAVADQCYALYHGLRKVEPPAGSDELFFCIDIDCKAKRALKDQWPLYADALIDEERYPHIPLQIKAELGRIFLQNNLHLSGEYKHIYNRVRKAQLKADARDYSQAQEEQEESENLLTEADTEEPDGSDDGFAIVNPIYTD
jgi:hypothetical protein